MFLYTGKSRLAISAQFNSIGGFTDSASSCPIGWDLSFVQISVINCAATATNINTDSAEVGPESNDSVGSSLEAAAVEMESVSKAISDVQLDNIMENNLNGSQENSTGKNELSGFWKNANETMQKFDANKDQHLDFAEFSALCEALFVNNGKAYTIEEKTLRTIFKIFDQNSNGVLCMYEFTECYNAWIKKILNPVSAIVVIDVQNDFISGSLALKNSPAHQDGAEVVEPINRMLENVAFDKVFYSLDWHPTNHISFADNVNLRKLDKSSPIQDPNEAKEFDVVVFEGPPLMEQKLWPRHCVQKSWGAQLQDDLKVLPDGQMIYKGTNPDRDSYSALFDNAKTSSTDLVGLLSEFGITDVYVCGLAADFCVGKFMSVETCHNVLFIVKKNKNLTLVLLTLTGFTGKDALDLGYRTIFVEDATRGITMEGINATHENLIENHAILVQTDEVKDMVSGVDRRPELGLKLALEIEKKRLQNGKTEKN
ncbi:Pyrazinamidase/nicotinamidase [Orchesella cincta]|uniref:nicotinamidase n=1 Tax=Orchesella cincta TaxID=48709 RepID=A0A1D2ND05_ORCCI|nr:Pyrazinamidase/nicotinamidase [Orchesella cincta]